MSAPRWASSLLQRIAPADRAEELIGDLEEVHARRVRLHGRFRAGLLTGRETIGLAAGLFAGRVSNAFAGAWMTGSEARLALRLMRRNPVMALTSVFALAAGIALACTGFVVVRAILSPELPFEGGDRIVEIRVLVAGTRVRHPVEAPLFSALRDGASRLEHVGAYRTAPINVAWQGDVELLEGVAVTPATFRWLPFRPGVGRLLLASDGEPGAPAVALIGQRVWERRFGGDPAIVGAQFDIGGVQRLIVGVVPEALVFPARADVWLPLAVDADAAPGISLFGVLAPGVPPVTAQADVDHVLVNWSASRPEVDPLASDVRRFGEIRRAGYPGATAVAVLVGLLIVVAGNVANLVVARTAARRSELAVRTALGASRRRLVAQLSLEILILGALAGALGLWASRLALSAFVRSEGSDLPVWMDLTLHVRDAAFVIGLTLLATVVAGVLPALRATRSDPASTLRDGGRGATSTPFGRLDDIMIVTQIALSVGILGASTMLFQAWRGAWDGRSLDIPAGQILAAQVSFDESIPPDSIAGLRRAVETAVRGMRDVIGVTAATHTPGADAPLTPTVIEPPAGTPASAVRRFPAAAVDEEFFDVLDVGPLAGRLFHSSDYASGAPGVALVNQPFVESWLGGMGAVGRRIRIAHPDDEGPPVWLEIVGVVPDLGLTAVDPDRAGGVYLPIGAQRDIRLFIRTEGPPAALAPRLRAAIFAVDPSIAVSGVDVLAHQMALLRRVYMILGSFFTSLGGVIMVLSLTAMYAILSFEVTRRTREIGVRVALGASDGRVLRDILGRVTFWVVVGGVLGTGLGVLLLLLARATLVLRFPETGAPTFALLAGGALVAGLIAAWIPARRVLSIRPIDALRVE